MLYCFSRTKQSLWIFFTFTRNVFGTLILNVFGSYKCIWNWDKVLLSGEGWLSKGWDTALGRSRVACRVELWVLGSNSGGVSGPTAGWGADCRWTWRALSEFAYGGVMSSNIFHKEAAFSPGIKSSRFFWRMWDGEFFIIFIHVPNWWVVDGDVPPSRWGVSHGSGEVVMAKHPLARFSWWTNGTGVCICAFTVVAGSCQMYVHIVVFPNAFS